MNSSFIENTINTFTNSKLKKQIFLTVLMLLFLLSGIVMAVPSLEKIYGIKVFNDGIRIGTDPNNASINSTGDARVHSLGVNCAADPNKYITTPKFDIKFVDNYVNLTATNSANLEIISPYNLALTANNSYPIYFQNNSAETARVTTTGLTMAAGKTITSCNIEPIANDTYYIGKNSTTSDQKAYKGVILKDTANTKSYRLEITNGAVVATEIYSP
jgi:hypothetical protein